MKSKKPQNEKKSMWKSFKNAMHKEVGAKKAGVRIRQLGDDGVYRKIESMDYFVKNPSSDDVLAINLSSIIEE